MIGKGTYGVVSSEYDTHLRKKVAIKKINDLFEHASDVIRILREIKLLWLLRHRDIVEIWHILLPLSRREFMDIYVIFEFMESDLHQVTEANDDQMPKHYRFFLYQLLRGLKYIHIGCQCSTSKRWGYSQTFSKSAAGKGDLPSCVTTREASNCAPQQPDILISFLFRLLFALPLFSHPRVFSAT